MSIARIQSAIGGTGAATASSFGITLGATPTADNIIVVAIGIKAVNAPRLSATNVDFYIAPSSHNALGAEASYIAVGFVRGSPGTVITVTNNGGASAAMCGVAAEYSGSNLGRLDLITSPSTGNSTTPATSNFTTVDAAELCAAALCARGTFASVQTTFFSSPTNSFSIVDQTSTNINTSNNDVAVALLERITSGVLSGVAAGATIGASNAWAATGAAVRETSVGVGQRTVIYG